MASEEVQGLRRGQEHEDELTLTIGSHLRHGGILHHSCRTSTSRHHSTRVGSTGECTTWPHGVLLVIHHLLLRLIGTRARLHLGVLSLRAAIVGLSCSVAVAIRSRVHGLGSQAGSKPKGNG